MGTAADTKSLTRIVLMFDGRDTQRRWQMRVRHGARRKMRRHEATYWKESATGKWEKQG